MDGGGDGDQAVLDSIGQHDQPRRDCASALLRNLFQAHGQQWLEVLSMSKVYFLLQRVVSALFFAGRQRLVMPSFQSATGTRTLGMVSSLRSRRSRRPHHRMVRQVSHLSHWLRTQMPNSCDMTNKIYQFEHVRISIESTSVDVYRTCAGVIRPVRNAAEGTRMCIPFSDAPVFCSLIRHVAMLKGNGHVCALCSTSGVGTICALCARKCFDLAPLGLYLLDRRQPHRFFCDIMG